MIKLLSVLFAVMACILFLGCIRASISPEKAMLNVVAYSANALLQLLEDKYERGGDAIIVRSYNLGDTKVEVEAKLAAHVDKWRPIWKAWAELRSAQREAANVVEGNTTSPGVLNRVEEAYCGLIRVWPEDLEPPLIPFSCSGE